MGAFLADEPAALLNFRRLARHVWPRHLRAVEEEIRQRSRGAPRKPNSPAR